MHIISGSIICKKQCDAVGIKRWNRFLIVQQKNTHIDKLSGQNTLQHTKLETIMYGIHNSQKPC